MVSKKDDLLLTLNRHYTQQLCPTVDSHTETLRGMKDDINVLYELLEMYVSVGFKVLAQNNTNPASFFNNLQEEYLACVSVANFFRYMATSQEEFSNDNIEETESK